jgi:hypothetical protein
MSRIDENAIKVASPDLLLIRNDPVPGNTMSSLLFQRISNVEVLSLSRYNLVKGANARLQPISNLSEIDLQYNSQTLIPLPDSSSLYFDNYLIKFEDYLPTEGSGPGGSNVYVEGENLVIELANVPSNILVEFDVMNNLIDFSYENQTNYGEVI